VKSIFITHTFLYYEVQYISMLLYALIIVIVFWYIGHHIWWEYGYEGGYVTIAGIIIAILFVNVCMDVENPDPRFNVMVEWFPYLGIFNPNVPDGIHFKPFTQITPVRFNELDFDETFFDKKLTFKDGEIGKISLNLRAFRIDPTSENLEKHMFKYKYYDKLISKLTDELISEMRLTDMTIWEAKYAVSFGKYNENNFKKIFWDKMRNYGIFPFYDGEGIRRDFVCLFITPKNSNIKDAFNEQYASQYFYI